MVILLMIVVAFTAIFPRQNIELMFIGSYHIPKFAINNNPDTSILSLYAKFANPKIHLQNPVLTCFIPIVCLFYKRTIERFNQSKLLTIKKRKHGKAK